MPPEMDFWRQADVVNRTDLNRYPQILVGAGGLGSPIGLTLLKMGVTDLTVYDFDHVEEHNVPNQLFRLSDAKKDEQGRGRLKVAALAEIYAAFTGVQIKAVPTLFPVPSKPRGIVITTVDSMQARADIWHGCIKFNMGVPWYLEARMGAEEGRIYVINPSDPDHVELYERSLYTDAEAVELPCTAKATFYTGLHLASRLAHLVKKVTAEQATSQEYIFDLVTGTVITAGVINGEVVRSISGETVTAARQ